MILRKRRSAREQPPSGGDENPGAAARVLSRVLEHSTRVQRPAVRAYLQRLRGADPGATPADIIAKLERRYLAAIIFGGAVVGSLAAMPGIGTLLGFLAVAGETTLFLEATAFFVLAVAEVHDIPAEHREQRRALVLAVLVGSEGKRAIADLLGPGRTGGAWLSQGTLSMPLPAMSQLNSRMLRYFVKRFTLRRSALAFGKLLPVGVGALIGAVGNRLMGKKIVANARTAFGAPPARWPVNLRLLPQLPDDRRDDDADDRREVAVALPDRRASD